MTENKRYRLSDISLNNPFAIYDNGEALTQNEVINKLNEQEEELQKMRFAFKQKYDYDIEDVIDEVYNWNGDAK